MEKPKLVTPTRTRKQVSTMMQLLDLSEAELTWITSHMGHTKDVQLNWYRKEDSTIELTKVARALMQVDIASREGLQNKKIDNLTLGIFFELYDSHCWNLQYLSANSCFSVQPSFAVNL